MRLFLERRRRRALVLCVLALILHRAACDGDAHEGTLLPIRLSPETMQPTLAALPSDSFLLVELFAPWCPVCQRFRPHYERVAARFNGPPSKPLLRIAQVDCVAQAKLCNEFGVRGYPTLRFGTVADFASGKHGVDVDSSPRDADAVLSWLNTRLSQQWTWDVPAGEAEVVPIQLSYPAPPVVAGGVEEGILHPSTSRMDLGDVELATLLSIEYAVQGNLLRAATRDDFQIWLALLAAAHPLPSCAAGAAALAEALPDVWPADQDAPPSLNRFKPCGVDRPRPSEWGACRGSTPDSRGYSCGLWTLFHALAARVETRHGGAMWLNGVRAFVGSFFTCDDCRKHFMDRTAPSSDIHSALTSSRGGSAKNAQLWAWRVHNEVNARLALEEGSVHVNNGSAVTATPGGGDAAFPKRPWPGQDLCANCSCSVPQGCAHTWPGAPGGNLWDEDAIFSFLDRYYGTQQSTVQADGEWDPFGLAKVAAEGEAAVARSTRKGRRAFRWKSGGKQSGRALDQQEPDGALTLKTAPGGWSPSTFILGCALTPVALYALFVTATSRAQSGRARGKGQKGGVLPMFNGRQKTGLGASLASAIHGQSLKTV